MAQLGVPSPCLRNWQKYCLSPRLRQACFVFEILPSFKDFNIAIVGNMFTMLLTDNFVVNM